MRFFIDTEFYERPGRIDLISIGVVAADGNRFYAENRDFDWGMIEALAHHPDERVSATPNWLLENVEPHLDPTSRGLSVADIRERLGEFIGRYPFDEGQSKHEFWGYYADYDWVVFCWIFGRMIDLPKGFPMYCRDIKQWADDLGNPELPKQDTAEHDALADAIHTGVMYYALQREQERQMRVNG